MAIFRPEPPPLQKSDRSAGDRKRHRNKVRESIRENIADIIAEESIIGKDKDRVIKVPLRGIKEFRFVYGENQSGVGQGSGNSQPGQVVGQTKKESQKGNEDKAGDRPGQDYYETEITLEEAIEIMFEDLAFPEMERRALRTLPVPSQSKRKGYRSKGIRPRLDRRETARRRIRRKQSTVRLTTVREEDLAKKAWEGKDEEFREGVKQMPEAYRKAHDLKTGEERFPFHEDDLKYRHVVVEERRESNAVVICMMDTSGSMDTLKKYLARSFFFLLYQFIASKYRQVEIVFIAHHTEANEVTEKEFFTKGESGGTFISSAYALALQVIADRYHPSLWNIYAFHCSDGDNFASDNDAALRSAGELVNVSNLFGYCEIKPQGSRYYESSMLNIFKRLEADNFQAVLIERKEDLWPTFKALLSKDRGKDNYAGGAL
ncbi:MAG: DUF444 family protein [Candidatus Liptonbacteria bacterium]|nr:DUF444 family protein [Candidatus Liptonbacteria bacterium]